MKTHPIPHPKAGNVLVICLFTCAVLGFAIASCFVYVRNQMVAAARSQTWNESLVISEAGIEDGLMLINKYSGTTVARGEWTNTAGSDSWRKLFIPGPSVFWVQRTLNGGSYIAYVTNTPDGQPEIGAVASKGFAGGRVNISRAIAVKAAPGSLFQGGLIAKGEVTLTGNVLVDSFNSQVAGMNTNGMYDPSIRRDNEAIASASSNVNATVSAGGSVEIYGKVYTGPEDQINYNGDVAIGSESFVDGGSAGLESGWYQNDLNIYIPDAPTPPTGGLPLPPKTTAGTNLNSFLLGSSSSTYNYQVGNLTLKNSEKLVVQGNVKLYVTGDFKVGAQNEVIIMPNSSLTLYAAGSVDLGGGGVVNNTGYATNLTINGLPTCTSIKYSGSSGFIGTIYAPQAYLELTGGGNSDVHFAGSFVASSIKLSGHTQVHYDESLNQIPAGPHYYAIWWKEIATSGQSVQTF